MAAYTRLSAEDVREIIALYNMPSLEKVEPLSLGISNSNYRLDLSSGESVILKVSNDKGVNEMLQEQDILQALGDYPYSLAPYKTKKGEGVYQWRGLYGAMFPFISGSKPMGSEEDIAQLGRALAGLHLFSLENTLEKSSIRCHSSVGFDLEGVLSYCEQASSVPEFKLACEELLCSEKIALWKSSELPKGLIHGDLYLDNALYEDGEIKALLDFEQAGIGYFLQDIGISISGSCLDKEGVCLSKVNAFLKGYQEVRALRSEELELMNFAITLGFLDISLWRIKRFYEGDLDPQRRDSYRELLELARGFNLKTK